MQLSNITFETVMSQRAPFAIQVCSTQLYPQVRYGQIITLRPVNRTETASVQPGTLVLAGIANRDCSNIYDQLAVLFINRDGDLHCRGAHVERGDYILLAVHVPDDVAYRTLQ